MFKFKFICMLFLFGFMRWDWMRWDLNKSLGFIIVCHVFKNVFKLDLYPQNRHRRTRYCRSKMVIRKCFLFYNFRDARGVFDGKSPRYKVCGRCTGCYHMRNRRCTSTMYKILRAGLKGVIPLYRSTNGIKDRNPLSLPARQQLFWVKKLIWGLKPPNRLI